MSVLVTSFRNNLVAHVFFFLTNLEAEAQKSEVRSPKLPSQLVGQRASLESRFPVGIHCTMKLPLKKLNICIISLETNYISSVDVYQLESSKLFFG